MANEKIWGERVAAWRASGLTAKEFTAGQPFSAQQMWNWSYRLRRASLAPSTPVGNPRLVTRAVKKCVRLARVVRVAASAPPVPPTMGLVVEWHGARIAVPPAFDRATFSTVLDAIECRHHARRP
jgi:hypothetical protein